MQKILLLSLIASVVVILLGVNRGFDVSDEGLYLLLLDAHQANEGGIYSYDLFFKLFYNITGLEFGIVGSRLLRLLSYFAGGYALALFWKHIQGDRNLNLSVFLISTLGLMSAYAFLPPSLSYNSISVVVVCFWLALLSKDEFGFLEQLGIGLVLAVLCYVKITAALAVGILTISVLFSTRRLEWRTIVLLLIPLVLLELLFFLLFKEAIFTRIYQGFTIISNRRDYNWLYLVKHNQVGVFWSSLVFIPFFIWSKWKGRFEYLLFSLISLWTIGVFYMTMVTDEWAHLALLISLPVLAVLMGRLPWPRELNKKSVFLLVLLFLPFALHFGSNVYFMRLGIHYWVFWLLAIGLVNQESGFSSRVTVISLFSLTAFVLILNGIWINPFGQNSLFDSKVKWQYRENKTIYLSKEMVLVLDEVKKRLGSSTNEEVVAVYRNPGWLVLLGFSASKTPGIWDLDQLQSFYPDFPDGFKHILYFPYQPLPENVALEFESEEYDLEQGELKLLWRK